MRSASLHRVSASAVGSGLAVSLQALLLAMPSTAQAQSGAPTLDEIIVTAQKREENLQSVPITVNVVTAKQAAASGVTDSTAIAAFAPGVVILQTPAVPVVFIRGVGSQNTSPGEEGSNALYVDGIYYATTRGMIFNFNNIERIEVLKGPQGTLFGRNATGGLINIVTREPTSSPVFEAKVGYANYQRATASLYASSPLANNLAADIALNYDNQAKGFGRNLVSGREIYKAEEYGVRGKIVWTPSDATKVTGAIDYLYSDSSLNAPRYVIPGSINTTGATALPHRYDIRSDNPYPQTSFEGGGVSLRVDQDLGRAQFSSISAYRLSVSGQNYDLDGSILPLFDIYYYQPENQLTQEFQIQSPADSKVHWIAGAFYLDSYTEIKPLRFRGISQTAVGGVSYLYSRLDTKSIAVYSQATIPVTDATNITAGVRYTKDRREFRARTETPNVAPLIRNPVNSKATYDKITYKVALDHNLTDDAMIFASASRGFKSGIYNTANPLNPPARPETLDAFEAGAKTQFLDNRVRFNVSGYYYRYKDIQLNQVVGISNFLFNAARARMYGLDLDAVATPATGLTLRASANLLNGKYTKFPGAPGTQPVAAAPPAGWVCATPSATAIGGNKSCVLDAAGNQTTRSPKLTFNLNATYERPTPYGKMSVSGSLYHNSGYYIEVDNRIRQKSYELITAQLGWRSLDDRYGVTLWGKNLGNADYYINVSTAAADNGTWQPPRTYGVTFDVRMN